MTDVISTPPVVTFQHVTLEEFSATLSEQLNDQDRYALSEKNIVDQVNYRDNLLAEQKIMGDKRRDLEQQLTESRLNPGLVKSLNTPKFILQIPDIKENYKVHLDFGEVKGLSDLDSTEYHGSKILKLNKKAEMHPHPWLGG
jgi:hypothetical protein